MSDPVIVSAIRTPVGRAPKGALSTTRPDDLAALAIAGALDRVSAVTKSEIDDVILGCAQPEGEQGWDVARWAILRAGLPVEIPGTTVNRLCSSGLEAIAIADQRIRSGGDRVVIAVHATIAIAVPEKDVHIVEGNCYGEIIPEERGTGGFGYDPIFLFPELKQTMAELAMDEKNRLSHRALAVMNAIPILKKIFAEGGL